MRAYLHIGITVLLAVIMVGCGDYRAINGDNVEFRRAEKARAEGKTDSAVKHYQECLRLAPGSYKAHLQLALIFEDHKGDLAQAIVHYQAYLREAPAEDLTQVRQLLDRAEEKYYEQLAQKFGQTPQLPEPIVDPGPSATDTVAQADPRDDPVHAPPEDPEPTTVPQPQPPPPEDQPPRPVVYVVQAGDNLSRISKRLYGTTRHAHAIFEANRHQLSSPDRLQIGQKLTLPTIEE